MNSVTRSTCCYCGVGCGVIIEQLPGQAVSVRGDPEHPANFGRLCTKGASLPLSLQTSSRLLTLTRRQRGSGEQSELTWAQALDEAAERFAAIIREHGSDSVAFYLSGQLLTEDYYVFNKLAKGLIGTNNVDTNSRLCMSSAVAGYKQTLGVDAPPCCYDDIDQAGTLLIAGANPAVAHPIVFRRIEEARAANPQLKLIVVDPRRSETAALADLHLAIRPGTDIALFNGLLNILIEEQRLDADYIEAHTEGFAELAAEVRHYPPARVAQICEIAVADLLQAARWFASNGPALSLYCQGLNQSAAGTHKNAALIHLHLATGQIGKPGAGPFSLTGQPNAMGGREVGGLANLLPAHRDLANPQHRAEVAKFWGVPHLPAHAGKSAVELFQSVQSGQIKAVWIACTNPLHSLPNQAAMRAALAAAEFVVVQDAFADTETAAYADLLLPASSWGEKEGTVTNSERRISRVRAAFPAPGLARADWEIGVDFARRLAAALDHAGGERLFPYQTPEDIFNEHRASTQGRDLDITGLSYALLETQGPQQWPFPEGASTGKARLYSDGVFPTASGRARFVVTPHVEAADQAASIYPLTLLSGRMRDHWHGMTRTGLIPRLFNLEDEPVLQMHACDMRHRGLQAGDLVEVRNGRGQLCLPVAHGEGLKRGTLWLPMHWGSRFMNSAGANAVTSDALDPYSRQPELKYAGVEVERLPATQPLVILRRCPDVPAALALAEQARSLFADFAYASLGFHGQHAPVVIFRAASLMPLAAERIAALDQLFALTSAEGDADSVVYRDPARAIDKKAVLHAGQLVGVRLLGETLAADWLKAALADVTCEPSLARLALAPSRQPPLQRKPRQIICKCADVSLDQIRAGLAKGQTLPALQSDLQCGTYCGGCVPELRRLVAEYAPQNAAAA